MLPILFALALGSAMPDFDRDVREMPQLAPAGWFTGHAFGVASDALSRDENVTLLAQPGSSYMETSLTVSRERLVYAVINRVDPTVIHVFASSDRGVTWGQPVQLPLDAGGIHFLYATDPCVITLDDGSFGLTYELLENEHPLPENMIHMKTAIAFTRSTDGVNWSAPVIVAMGESNLGTLFADRPFLSIDRRTGTLFVTWSGDNGGSDPTMVSTFSKSTDHGATWGPLQRVPTTSPQGLPQFATTADGSLVMAMFELAQRGYLARRSTDGGVTWEAPQMIGTNALGYMNGPRTGTLSPAILSLASWGDRVFCIYPTADGVFFTRSADDGRTWSQPLQLGGANGDAVLPTLAVNNDTGELIVTWLDSRDDASNKSLSVYASRSLDGGATFETPRAFSSPFAAGGRLGDCNGATTLAPGLAITGFSTADGALGAARLSFTSPLRRRTAH